MAVAKDSNEDTNEDAKQQENEKKERAELSRLVGCLCNYPAIKRFATRLASTQAHVVRAGDLMKSLKNDEDGTNSLNDAFEKFWGQEAFKEELLDEYKKFCSLRRLINEHATEERVNTHETRMDWVKGDPILGTETEDNAHLIRKALSLSVLYWMDINLYKIVDLRGIVIPKGTPNLMFDYAAEHKNDEKALRKQIEVVMGKEFDQKEQEDAFEVIRAQQLSCSTMQGNVGVRWQVSYDNVKKFVSYMICSVTTP